MAKPTTPEASEHFFLKYDDLINGCLDRLHYPGTSIAVLKGDEIFAKGYGFSRLPDEKVTPETVFNVASMTKVFIAASLSLLVDDPTFPSIQWSTPISHLLREDFVLSSPQYTSNVTIEDILSHRSGLPDSDDACYGIHSSSPDTPKSVTRKLRHLPITASLRTKYQYCNVMYVVAVHLIQTLTSQSVISFLRSRIWGPLGMNDSFFGLDDLIAHGRIDDLAIGYRWSDSDVEKGEEFIRVPWPVQPEGSGAGEMKSTSLDYLKFIKCLIRKTPPLSRLGHEELIKPRTITCDKVHPFHSLSLYALGLEVETYHGETVIGHGGSTNGFGCKMLFIPRLEWGVVILANSADSYVGNERIAWTMIDDLLGVEMGKRFDWDAWEKEEEEEKEFETKSDLYPSIPHPPIPLSLPLEKYTGKYKDEGYGVLKVELQDGRLKIDCTDRTWRFVLSFEHVSGEFFVAHLLDVESHNRDTLRAQFVIDVDGTVGKLGIEFVKEMKGEKIWFWRMKAPGDLN